MIRFVVKEVYVGHVVHAQGQPETRLVTFDGDQEALERFLRYEEQPQRGTLTPCTIGKQPAFLTRELIGVELL